MNEASVSSPWMSQMRLHLPGAEVIKHRDSSMIGLPDCSITWERMTVWVEFKLVVPLVSWGKGDPIDYASIFSASPTQYSLVKKLNLHATGSYYLVWVKKSKTVELLNPVSGFKIRFENTKQASNYFAELMRSKRFP